MSNIIPDGWELATIGSLGKVITGSTPSTQEPKYWGGDVPFISPADFDGSVYVKETQRKLTKLGSDNGRLLPKDSVLVTCIGSLGGIAMAASESTTNQQINSLVPSRDNAPRFCFYNILFNIDELTKNAGTTTIPIINKSTFELINLLRPSLPEQQKIASILTAVDEVIESTKAQINKLKDLKTGMMQELLTKGIGHTEFKDSPVGRIPKAWKVVELEKLCTWMGVGIATSTTHAYTDIGVPLLRNQNILAGTIDKADILRITKEFSEENNSKKIKERDVITIRTGYPGKSAVVTEEFHDCHTFTTLISRPDARLIDSDFLALIINSDYGMNFVAGGQAGGAQQNLNVSILKIFPVKLPSLMEQRKIFDLVSSVSQKIELVEKKRNHFVAIKKALMQDLLTGKVRVTIE